MRIQISWNPRQLAERWVSITVLIGCTLITAGIIYLSYTADNLGEKWASGRSNELQEAGLSY
ncbi:MAG: hypothetical protein ABI430_00500 [Candidatus Taylorbacteria bacterium]